MRITTQGDYALRCILNIARNSYEGPVSISRIVNEESLPLDYIEQLLMKLRRHRLIKSVRGVKGGYLLARNPNRINVKDVLEAVEGDAFEVICTRKKNVNGKKCVSVNGCTLKNVWLNLKHRIDVYLERTTVQSLLKKKEGKV